MKAGTWCCNPDSAPHMLGQRERDWVTVRQLLLASWGCFQESDGGSDGGTRGSNCSPKAVHHCRPRVTRSDRHTRPSYSGFNGLAWHQASTAQKANSLCGLLSQCSLWSESQCSKGGVVTAPHKRCTCLLIKVASLMFWHEANKRNGKNQPAIQPYCLPEVSNQKMQKKE